MTVALIDGDIIAYKAAFISTDIFDDGEELFDPTVVNTNVRQMIDDWRRKAKAGGELICLSDDDHRYFRHTVYPEYKGNRSERTRPKALDCAYQFLKDFFKTVQYDGLEADDVMGILAGSPDLSDPIIVSIDKDMMTVPCKLLNPNKMSRPIKISKASADRQMLMQALMGDRTDNYPGVDGIGPVKAERIISEHSDIRAAWQAVVETFGNEEDALTMTRLARILRYDDFNQEKGEVRLWHPTKKTLWISSTPINEPSKEAGRKSSKTRKRRSRKTGTKTTGSRKKTIVVSPISGP